MYRALPRLSYYLDSETDVKPLLDFDLKTTRVVKNTTSIEPIFNPNLEFDSITVAVYYLQPVVAVATADNYTKPESNKINDTVAEIKEKFKWFQEKLYNPGTEKVIKIELEKLLIQNLDCAMLALRKIFNNLELNEDLLNEILIQLGQIENNITESERLDLLKLLLFHKSSTIRDGAILGISYINDKSVIPTLKVAYSRETDSYIKEDIFELLDDLNNS